MDGIDMTRATYKKIQRYLGNLYKFPVPSETFSLVKHILESCRYLLQFSAEWYITTIDRITLRPSQTGIEWAVALSRLTVSPNICNTIFQ